MSCAGSQGRNPGRLKLRTRAGLCTRLARVSPLLATNRMAWMMAFRFVRGRNVLYLDTLMEPQLYKPNRLWQPESCETRRILAGYSPDTRRILAGDNFDTPGGASDVSARPRNISQAHGQRAEGSFPVFGPLWKAGRRRLALSRRAGLPARPCTSGLPQLDAALDGTQGG